MLSVRSNQDTTRGSIDHKNNNTGKNVDTTKGTVATKARRDNTGSAAPTDTISGTTTNNNYNSTDSKDRLHSSITTASISSGASSSASTTCHQTDNIIHSQQLTVIMTQDEEEKAPPSYVAVPTNHTVVTVETATDGKTEEEALIATTDPSVTFTNIFMNDDTEGVKTSTSFTTVVSDPPISSTNSNATDSNHNMNQTKPHHKRRSNSDIPLSVQTGTFLQQQHHQQQHYHYYPPPPPQFDYYNRSNSERSLQPSQQQASMLWQQQQQQTQIRNIAGSYGSHISPIAPNMYHHNQYNPNIAPLPSPMVPQQPTAATSPASSKAGVISNYNQQQSYLQQHAPPPPISPNHQRQQQQQNPYYFNNYPIPQQRSQPIHYYPNTGRHPPPMYYQYPPPAPIPTTSGSTMQQHPPPMIQKSSSYTGNGRTTPTVPNIGSTKPVMVNVSADERQPLLKAPTVKPVAAASNIPNHRPRAAHPTINTTTVAPATAATVIHGDSTNKHHRRSLSSSAAEFGNYGAFWMNNGDDNEQQRLATVNLSGKNNSQQQAHVKFSPISEFRKLQKGLSPTASSTSRKQQQSSTSFSPTTRTDSNNNAWLSSSMRDIKYIPHNSPSHQLQGHNASRPQHHRTMSHNIGGDGGGGGSNSNQSSRLLMLQRGESLRKMHARQQSAQLIVEDIKGVEQPLVCRNVLFLLLFVFHLVFMIYLGQQYGPNAFLYRGTDTETITVVYSSLIYIAGWSGLFAVAISVLLLGAMTYFASHFVQIALFFMITLSFIWGTIGIGLSPKTTVPVTGIIALALAVAYTFIVWDRIPFASANLVTALSALRDFRGMIYVAFGFQIVALFYSVIYSILVFGIYDAMQDHGPLNLSQEMTYAVYTLLIVSFCWTLEVIQSTVQAITAAVVYKWWHEGRTEQNATLVKESCLKTIFYSMGSICFGSLVVTPVRFLRWLFILFRPSSTESSSLMCLHECMHYIQSCISFCVDSLSAKCNTWAYTYIGMYHYGFLEAGGNATELFEKRGWSTIVSDDLVPNVLFLTSLVIGGVTGCFAYLLSELDRLAIIIPKDDPGLAPFIEGLIIGLVLPSVVFGIISSAVNSVLVCFACSPMDFEIRHRDLSHNMRAAWRDVWPRALHVDDAVALRMTEANAPFLHSSYQNRAPSPF